MAELAEEIVEQAPGLLRVRLPEVEGEYEFPGSRFDQSGHTTARSQVTGGNALGFDTSDRDFKDLGASRLGRRRGSDRHSQG